MRSRHAHSGRRPGRDGLVLAGAAVAPLAVAAALVPLRVHVANTSVALVLVLLVTAAG
jgi:hypothetical protein